MLDQTVGQVSQFLLFIAVIVGAVFTATWLGIILWTWRDMRARSRDVLAQGAATVMVGILHVFGLLVYLMLRPRETLAEAYERSLEEEALLQGIEEKPKCPGCGRTTDLRWQVCPYCYTRLKKQCVNCSEMLQLSWNMCPYCTAQQPGGEGRSQNPVRSRRNGSSRPMPEVQDNHDNYAATGQPLEFIEEEDA